jgi:hypothetical protein
VLAYCHRMRSRGEGSLVSRHGGAARSSSRVRRSLVAVALSVLLLVVAASGWFWWANGPGASSGEVRSAGGETSGSATSAPLFASDEEALAAATAAYAEYLQVSDAIAVEGGADSERISSVVFEDYRESSLDDFASFADQGLRAVGMSKFDTVSLQNQTTSADGETEVVIYLCLDVSSVRILDQTGADVTPVSRNERLPLEIEVKSSSTTQDVRVSRSDIWSGGSFC